MPTFKIKVSNTYKVFKETYLVVEAENAPEARAKVEELYDPLKMDQVASILEDSFMEIMDD